MGKAKRRERAFWQQFGQEQQEKIRVFYEQGYPLPPINILKTEEQIEGIRKSSQLTKSLLDELETVIKPGMTTDDINTWVHTRTIESGALPAPLNYRGFPKSICTSLNEVICHGIPSSRVLADGDILNVDITCILDGYYGDSCRMYQIGDVSPSAKKLVTVAKECLEIGIQAVVPYQPLNVIGEAIEAHAHQNGFSVVVTATEDEFVGADLAEEIARLKRCRINSVRI